MKNILVIEDSPECQLILKRALEDNFALTMAMTASAALRAAQEKNIDLIVLDVELPDGDGFQICNSLRMNERTKTTPIIFLTAKSDLKDKVKGFSLGADDYVVKPFEPLELVMRIQAKLARAEQSSGLDGLFQYGDIQIDLSVQKAFLMHGSAKTNLDLTPMELKLLFYFAKHPGEILPREVLLKSVWGGDITVAQRTIDKHVSSLKKKLLSRGDYIRAIYRKGYSFSENRESFRRERRA